MNNRHTVHEFGDLGGHDRLTSTQADAVTRALLRGGESVVVVAMDEWLVEEKDLDGLDRHPELVAGTIRRETEDALLVAAGGAEDWVPKSCVCVFELAEKHSLSTPQEGLDAFADGGRPIAFDTPDAHGSIAYSDMRFTGDRNA